MMRALLVVSLLASHAHADLDNRRTASAGFGVVWAELDGVPRYGMALQPTFTRTFRRLELQADYLVGDLRDPERCAVGGYLHRLGVSGRFQLERTHLDGEMALDVVIEAGVGLQYLQLDNGDVVARNDFALGVVLRSVMALQRHPRSFMGIEATGRLLVSPSGDLAGVVMFGLP